jgi:aspartyl-tRNA(Asn)/glutamyl-tRNA(Gln) amidotransferase subunit A
VDATELTDCTATELLDLYRRREASPVEAVGAVLDRVERLQPVLNCFALVVAEEALEAAAASAARWQVDEPIGPLDGVPASVKDLLPTRGWPTLRGVAPSTRIRRGTSMRRRRRGCERPERS